MQGEAADLGLAPGAGLRRVELKVNHNFLQSFQVWEPGAECEGLFMCMGPRTHFSKKPMMKKD